MDVVNEVLVPHHAMPKPPRRQAVFHWNLKIAFLLPYVAFVGKGLFEDFGIKDFAKKVMSHYPLIVPRDEPASLFKQGCTGALNLPSFQTVKHPVMEL